MGLYPTTTVRRVNAIKQMMAESFTIEEIQRSFLRWKDDIESLDRGLRALCDGFVEELSQEGWASSRRKVLMREVAEVRRLAEALVGRIESLERQVVSPLERAAKARAFSAGASGGAGDLLVEGLHLAKAKQGEHMVRIDTDELADPRRYGDVASETPATSRKVRHKRRLRARSKTIAPKRLSKEELRLGALLPVLDAYDRPRTRGECMTSERPCPFVSCKHHLYLDVNPETGSMKLNFPDLEVWEMKETCSLDVADRSGITLEEVGEILNLTRERIRQVEVRGLLKLKMVGPGEEPLPGEPGWVNAFDVCPSGSSRPVHVNVDVHVIRNPGQERPRKRRRGRNSPARRQRALRQYLHERAAAEHDVDRPRRDPCRNDCRQMLAAQQNFHVGVVGIVVVVEPNWFPRAAGVVQEVFRRAVRRRERNVDLLVIDFLSVGRRRHREIAAQHEAANAFQRGQDVGLRLHRIADGDRNGRDRFRQPVASWSEIAGLSYFAHADHVGR